VTDASTYTFTGFGWLSLPEIKHVVRVLAVGFAAFLRFPVQSGWMEEQTTFLAPPYPEQVTEQRFPPKETPSESRTQECSPAASPPSSRPFLDGA
jgi:hypothetical protein